MTKVLRVGALRLFTGLVLVASLFATLPSISTLQAMAEGSTIDVDITQGAAFKTENAYAPNPVHALVGDTVIWTNKDATVHTATSGTASGGPTGLFGGSASAPAIIAPSATQSFTFTEEGEFPYYCVLHPVMVGTVIVGGNSELTVKTDKPIYDFQEEITISGKVSDVREGARVIIRIDNDEGVPIRLDPVDVGSDGRFSYHIVVGGALFTEGAIYTVTATYRQAEVTTTFRISGTSSDETCQGLLPTLVGTERNDILNGTRGPDVIVGLRGNDVINGLSGDDIICGGLGLDSINGGDGDDKLLGGNENDSIDGAAGNDLIWGGTGWDRLIGGLGNDTVRGGIGNDRLFGGDGNDSLFGQEGDDIVDGLPETEDKRIFAELSDTRYLLGELVVIAGSIDGNDVEVGESVFVRVVDNFSNIVFQQGVEPDADGDFVFDFQLGNDAFLGTYSVGLSYVGYDDEQLAFIVASHNDDIFNIRIEVNDEHSPGDEVEIMGSIQDLSDDADKVTVTITEPDGTGDADDVTLEDDEFFLEYHLGDPADDGIYIVEVEYDGESAFSFFLVDEEDDSVEVVTDESIYELGDEVEIVGEVNDLQMGEEEVEIIVLDPAGEEVVEEAELDDGEFAIDIDLDDAPPGRFAVIVVYDGEESGFTLFEVEEDGNNDGPITVELSKPSYRPGGEVLIGGSVDEVEAGAEVIVTVEDPNGDELFSDSIEPSNSGDFEFEFELDDDAEAGSYTVLVEYEGDEMEATFTVTTSSSGGSPGNDGGLSAKLSNTSLLAGETLMIRGVVPRIITDEDGVSITILNPDRGFVAASFPDPESDRSYSTSIVLPSSLDVGEGYEVIVYYDGNEVELSFDITGKAPTDDAITVETDKASYAAGSTVTITGRVDDNLLKPGQQGFLRVFNPESAPYRFDPIIPAADGSYSYSLIVGGPLGVSGEWIVKVSYAENLAEITFDLAGGIRPSTG